MDDGALPTTLDYNGPGSVTFVRQKLVRGSLKFGPAGRWTRRSRNRRPIQRRRHGAGRQLAGEAADPAARLRYESDRGTS